MFSNILADKFFDRDAAEVAKDLLGKVLRIKYNDHWLAAMIIETEAYYLHEKGSHASLGYTTKRKALFMPAGTIYMYHARGGDSLNTSCRGAGNAVLFKAGIPYFDNKSPETNLSVMQQLNPQKNQQPRNPKKLCSGQTLLCKSLGIKVKTWDQKNYDPEKIYIEDVGYQPQQFIQTTRLGIPKGRDEHLMLRFIDFEYVSYCTSNPLTKKNWHYGKNYKIKHLTTKSLASLTALITRPKKQAQQLAAMINAAGGKAIKFPTLKIVAPKDKSSLLEAIKNLKNFSVAIFTSSNAVLKTLPYWQKTPSNLVVIAMGPATANCLTSWGFRHVIMPPSPYNSEELLSLPQLNGIAGKKIIIFTGEGGRELIAETLRQRGATISLAIAYRRIQPKFKKITWKPADIDIIITSSNEALKNLLAMLPKAQPSLFKKVLLVASQRLYLLAKKLGFQTIIIAEDATDEAMFKALKAWYSKNKF